MIIKKKKNADPDNAGQLIYCSELILAHQKKKILRLHHYKSF